MDVKSFILVVAFLANIFLGLALLVKGKKSKNRASFIYGITAWAVALWTLSMIIYRLSGENLSVFWCKVLYVSAIFIPPIFLYFTFNYLGKKISFLKRLILIVLPTLTIIYLTIKGDYIIKDVIIRYGKEKEIVFGKFYLLYAFYISIYFLWPLLNLFFRYKKAEGISRVQLRYMFYGTFVSILFGCLFNLILPWLGDFRFNWLGQIATLIMVFSISYAIFKYRLMDIKLTITKIGIYILSLSSILVVDYLAIIFLGNYLILKIFYPLSIVVSIGLYPLFYKVYSRIASRYLYYSFYSFKNVISDLIEEVAYILDINQLSDKVITTLFRVLKLNRAVVLIKNFETGKFEIKKNIGFKEDNGISLVRDNFLTRWLEENNKPLVYEEVSLMVGDALFEKEKNGLIELKKNMVKIEAEACLPLIFQNKLIGIVILGSKPSGEAFSKEDIDLLKILTGQLSIAFENARLYSELKDLSSHLQEKVDQQTRDLKELLKAKDEFLHIVSHQLRTPLTVLRGYLDFWATGKIKKLPKERQEEIKKYIIVSADRLHKIIKDMLEVVDLEGGRMVAKKQVLDIKDLIENIYTKTLKTAYKEKNLSFKITQNKGETFSAYADPRFLEIVIQNVLDNARKYTEKGKVEVILNKSTDFINILVKDTGIGLSIEDKKRLFGKFIRGEKAKNIDPNGTGLGLYVSKKIMKMLGGDITITSKGINQGTSVLIKIPLFRAPV